MASRKVALGDRGQDFGFAGFEVFLGSTRVGVIDRRLEDHDVVPAFAVEILREGLPQGMGAEPAVVDDSRFCEDRFDEVMRMGMRQRPNQAIRAGLAAWEEGKGWAEGEFEAQGPQMAPEGALQLWKDRHPAGPAVAAFQVARGDADLWEDGSVAHDLAHGEGKDFVDPEAGEPLGRHKSPVAGFEGAENSEELPLFSICE